MPGTGARADDDGIAAAAKLSAALAEIERLRAQLETRDKDLGYTKRLVERFNVCKKAVAKGPAVRPPEPPYSTTDTNEWVGVCPSGPIKPANHA